MPLEMSDVKDDDELLMISSPPWILTATGVVKRMWRTIVLALVVLLCCRSVIGTAPTTVLILVCLLPTIISEWRTEAANVEKMFRRRAELFQRRAVH